MNATEKFQPISSGQLRAARGLLGWSQERLATESGVNRSTILRFENGQQALHTATAVVLRQAFERAGVEFLDETGVKLRPDSQP